MYLCNVHHTTDVILFVSPLVGYFSSTNLISIEIVLVLMFTYIELFSIKCEIISYVLFPEVNDLFSVVSHMVPVDNHMFPVVKHPVVNCIGFK